jgi:hypothetical protein
MKSKSETRITIVLAVVCAAMFAISSATRADAQADQLKIGVLPFVDNTGTGSRETGAEIGRAVQAEFANSTDLQGRVLKLADNTAAEDIDSAKAVELARAGKVDAVIVGTVLQASSEESNNNFSGPSVFGQSLGGSKHSQKSVVALQADLYDTTSGKKIESIRVTGKASSNKLGANASTTLGSMNTNGADFQNSTLGKAFHDAVTQLVQKVQADKPKMMTYKPAAGAPAAK